MVQPIFIELLPKKYENLDQKVNQQQNTVHLEQQIFASPENFTLTLLVILETFRRSGHLEPFGAIWSHFDPFGVIWSHLEPFGAIWSNLEQFGAIWSHLEPFGAIWSNLEPSRALWSHLEPFGVI